MKKGKQSINRLQSYLTTPFLFTVVIIVANVAVLAVDRKAAAVMAPASCICLFFSIALYFYRKPLLLKELVNFSMEHAQVQNQLLRALPMPYAIIDEAGKILWINYAFQREIGKEKNKNLRAPHRTEPHWQCCPWSVCDDPEPPRNPTSPEVPGIP